MGACTPDWFNTKFKAPYLVGIMSIKEPSYPAGVMAW
jgi:hypothetical protein